MSSSPFKITDEEWREFLGLRATAQRAWVDARIAERMERTPVVEIRNYLTQPRECKVWVAGRLVFDGVSRDALIAAQKAEEGA